MARRFLHWLHKDSAFHEFIAYILIMALGMLCVYFFVSPLHAATSYDVNNLPVMYLRTGITATQTGDGSEVDIQFIAPTRNLESITIPAMSGAVFEFRDGDLVESVYSSRVIVNTSSQVVTLTGTVIRDLAWNNCNTFTGNSDGNAWRKGTEIRLADDCRLFNLKVNKDRSNVMTSSGALTFSGSGSFAIPTFANTTARNQQLGSSPGGPARMACSTSDGVCYLYIGGAWTTIGSSTTANASITAAGKVQISTQAMLANLTDTGSTGALNVITPSLFARNGTGATSANKIPLLDSNGGIPLSMGGNGTGSSVGIATGAILVFQRTSAPRPLYATSANQVIVSTDGRSWNAGTAPQDADVLTGSLINSGEITNNGASSTFTFNQTGSLTTSHLNTKGKMFRIYASGIASADNEATNIYLRFGTSTVATCTTAATTGQSWNATFIGTVRSAGASGVIEASISAIVGAATCSARTNTTSFDTTTNKTVNIGMQGSSAKDFTMTQFIIESLSQ